MEQELAPSLGNVVHAIGLEVFGNVAANQPDLAVADLGIGIFQIRFTPSQALDLCSGQHDTGLDSLQEFIVVTGAAIRATILMPKSSALAAAFALLLSFLAIANPKPPGFSREADAAVCERMIKGRLATDKRMNPTNSLTWHRFEARKQVGNRSFGDRIDGVGGDFREWLEDEPAHGHARMGNGQLRGVDDLIVEK